MNREETKKLLPAITHFADGGNLWRYNNRLEKWECQTTVEQLNKESNIIEDKHFESRKAFALGEEIEKRIKYQDDTDGQWNVTHYPTWNNISYEYRPKSEKPVYEWQWIYKINKIYHLTDIFYTEEEANDGSKFEPSKRIRK